MKLSKSEIEFLNTARVARLATVDDKGVPHNVPVCPLYARGSLYVASETSAKKIRNLRSNDNVAIVFDDYVEAWTHLRGIMIQGQAKLVGKQQFLALRKGFYEKFGQYEESAPLDDRESSIIEIIPRHKFSWGLS